MGRSDMSVWVRSLLLGVLLVSACWGALAQPKSAQAKRWAAIDPNREANSPVAWGANEEEARQRAVEACKRVSKTCANGPASTDDMREVFALMCCAAPKPACAAGAGPGRREAVRGVREMLTESGYSDCSVRHYLSAGTGKKQ
jgi:hypothetical protein